MPAKRRLTVIGEPPRRVSSVARGLRPPDELSVRVVLSATPSIGPAAQMAAWMMEEVPTLRPLSLGGGFEPALVVLGNGVEAVASMDVPPRLRAAVHLRMGPHGGPEPPVRADKELRLLAPSRAVARAVARGVRT